MKLDVIVGFVRVRNDIQPRRGLDFKIYPWSLTPKFLE